jgi:hypothetical protein
VVAGDKVMSRTWGRRRSDGGGWSKMSDEALAREREPIERVRARLEALVMANAAPRCGARSKRTGKPCRAAAMLNGRCKVHGGKSTGPRTPEGLERSKRARWKHGYYSREAKAERSRVRGEYLCSAICACWVIRLGRVAPRGHSRFGSGHGAVAGWRQSQSICATREQAYARAAQQNAVVTARIAT